MVVSPPPQQCVFLSDRQEKYLVLCDLQSVYEQLLVLRQQGEHHSQTIENQQEAFRQRSLVCKV